MRPSTQSPSITSASSKSHSTHHGRNIPPDVLPNASVDLYVSRVVLPYTDIPAALAEAARVLVPGGHLWITLHPVSMTMWELAQAARQARLKEVVRRMVVLWNGLVFHVFGTSRRVLGIRDASQSTARMTRALATHFSDIRVSRGRHFLIVATRRSS